jgi:hypothetical protein
MDARQDGVTVVGGHVVLAFALAALVVYLLLAGVTSAALWLSEVLSLDASPFGSVR